MSLQDKQDQALQLKKEIAKLQRSTVLYAWEKKKLKELKAAWKKLDKELQKAIEKQLKIPGINL